MRRLILLFAAVAAFPVFASDFFVIPEGDIASILVSLATSYKTLGVLGCLVLATLLSVQLLKRFIPEDFKWKRLIVLCVSIVYSVLAGVVVPGSSVVSVIVSVFITSGGAIALFETLKGAGVFAKI